MKIVRREVRNSHKYDVFAEDGAVLAKDLTGITTIINVLNKEGLVPWAARLAADAMKHKLVAGTPIGELLTIDGYKIANDYKKARGDRGTDLHASCEYLSTLFRDRALNDALVIPVMDTYQEEEQWLVAAFVRWLHETEPEILNVEKYVACVHCGYAATLDLDLRFPDREHWIIDVKSTAGVYDSMALQTCGQAHAYANTRDDGKHMNMFGLRTGILWLSPKAENGCQLIPTDNNRETLAAYLNTLGIYRWQKNKNRMERSGPAR